MAETILELMRRNKENFRAVNPYASSRARPIEAACASLIYGVELEIENASPDWRCGGVSVTTDGSLRNSGYEFITSPCTISVLNHVLTTFFERYPCNSGSNYSDRTSVHVHANVQDLTLEQLSTVLLLYQVFEKLLFAYVGEDRDSNIFCVPWSQTSLSYNFVNRVLEGVAHVRNWQKYTALNVLPVWELGTIEFRHMAGTNDVNKIITWCQLIGCMFEFAKKTSLEDTKNMFMELNTTSAYKLALDTVFRQWADVLKVDRYDAAMEEGVINMKYMVMGESENKATKRAIPRHAMTFEQRMRELDAATQFAAAAGGGLRRGRDRVRVQDVEATPTVQGFFTTTGVAALVDAQARTAHALNALDHREAGVVLRRAHEPGAPPAEAVNPADDLDLNI